MPINDRDRPAGLRAWAVVAGLIALFVISLFVLYAWVYRSRGYRLPIGFDAPWYVWRADLVAAQGIGAAGTAARPGHAILSAVLGSVTGMSQLRLAVVFPLVLAPIFGLAVGTFVRSCVALDGWAWFATTILSATLLGSTRLVGENVATLLTLTLLVVALIPLTSYVAHGKAVSFAAASLLLLSGGLTHWLFLAVFEAMIVLAAICSTRGSLRERAAGTPLARTDSGALLAVAGFSTVVMAILIGPILRAPLSTIDVPEDPSRFVPKLKNDLRRLFLPVLLPAYAVGALSLIGQTRKEARRTEARRRGVSLRVAAAWAAVGAIGMLFGLVTNTLPPHRFLELIVVVPGVLLLAAAVRLLARSVLARWGRVAAFALWGLAVVGLSLPGLISWFRSGPEQWIDAAAFQQARTAGLYVQALPDEKQVVFVIGAAGPAGSISAFLKERTIRLGMPPGRQEDVHFFVGNPEDLLAGRRTLVANARVNEVTLPLWEDTREVLSTRPAMIVLNSLGPRQYIEATRGFGARVIAPGMALLQGPSPEHPLGKQPLPTAVPPLRVAALDAFALLLVLSLAGAGWVVAFAGRQLSGSPGMVLALAPSVGAGALILLGFAADELGATWGGAGGALVLAAAAVSGAAAGWFRLRMEPGPERPRLTARVS